MERCGWNHVSALWIRLLRESIERRLSAVSGVTDCSPPSTQPRRNEITIEVNGRSRLQKPLGTICFILGSTGMRIGEALALRIEDLDFQRKLIHIRHSVYAGMLGTPKSEASMASLPMPPNLAVRLKAFLASKHYRPNSQWLLFANRRGCPFSANKLREKKLRPLLSSLGIPLAGFHAFRHGVATTLIDRGASITTVGAQLRHSDPRITLGLYAHVVPQSQRDAVEGLASALSSGQLLTQRLNADSVQGNHHLPALTEQRAQAFVDVRVVGQ